ncbi:hypothetical protein EVAR_93151_1 [Eumeta japonica]|uniref:Uncharacterized protein n=1 Tax=Eumeta variegata TaxID=151549 RepID=A0A4C1TII4_EUMVA|nr:hypothetical protein EVAR_93151_1 [Eumeta japonica]
MSLNESYFRRGQEKKSEIHVHVHETHRNTRASSSLANEVAHSHRACAFLTPAIVTCHSISLEVFRVYYFGAQDSARSRFCYIASRTDRQNDGALSVPSACARLVTDSKRNCHRLARS